MLDSGSPERTPDYLNFKAVLLARAAAQKHRLHHSLRHLLEVVAGFTNGHPAFPSYETLADITGLGVDAVRKQAKALVDQGYLAQTRRKGKNGGWGQPEWALGYVCQVGSPSHLPPDEVGSPSHSSGITVPLASGITVPQKRLSVVHGDSVDHGNGGGVTKKVGKREDEKGTGATPRPPSEKRQKVAAVHDAIKAQGGEPTRFSNRDAGAICGSTATPEEIATAWLRLISGQWPPASASERDKAFAHNNHMMWFAVDRLTAILSASTPVNGGLSPASLAKLRRHEEAEAQERNHRRVHTPSPL